MSRSAWNARGLYAITDAQLDRKSTRLNSSHVRNSYAVFCLNKNTLAADVYPSIVNQDLVSSSSFFPVQFSGTATPGTPSLGTAPPTPVFPTIPSNGKLPLPNVIGDSTIPTNQKIAYVDSYDLTVERVVLKDATLSLGYVENVGRHLNFFFNVTAATEIYTLSLHDALPI